MPDPTLRQHIFLHSIRWAGQGCPDPHSLHFGGLTPTRWRVIPGPKGEISILDRPSLCQPINGKKMTAREVNQYGNKPRSEGPGYLEPPEPDEPELNLG